MSGRLTAILTATLLAAQAAGCGNLFHTTPSKPQLYRVEGRVLDSVTRQGLARARVLLRATVPTQMNSQALTAAGSPDARGGGVVQLSNYGMTDANGAYAVELSEGFGIVQHASRIRVEASLAGYVAGGIDLPIPIRDQPLYKAPDLFMAEGWLSPPSTLPRGVFVPGLPSAPGTGAPGGPRPKRPNPIPWK
jgi:hypothetical protein